MCRLINIFLVMILLSSCANYRQNIIGVSSSLEGISTLLVSVSADSTVAENFICYSEIQSGNLLGISCQNDKGITYFSVGFAHGKATFEVNNKILYKSSPEIIVDSVVVTLFDNYIIENNSYKLVEKTKQGAVISYNKIMIRTKYL